MFDTLAGDLGDRRFAEVSAPWLKEIISRLEGQGRRSCLPAVLHGSWPVLVGTGARVLGIDCQVRGSRRSAAVCRLGWRCKAISILSLLTTTPETVVAATRALLEDMRGLNGHILNLGHGVPPDSTLENIGALVDTVREFA